MKFQSRKNAAVDKLVMEQYMEKLEFNMWPDNE